MRSNVAGALQRLLRARVQALFRAKLADSRTAEDFAELSFERGPGGNVGLMVPKPQVSNAGEVNTDSGQFHGVVPFVEDTHEFVGREPVVDVVVISAAEYWRVPLTDRAGACGGLRSR